MRSLLVAKQSKQHRQGRHLLYEGFLMLFFNTKWKQNKSQNPPIMLHWPEFCSQWVFPFPLQQEVPALPREEHQTNTPHRIRVSTAEQADAAGTHASTQWHTKQKEPQQYHTNLRTDYSNVQLDWCRTVLLTLLSILAHLFWSFNTFCYWEVLHCWCLQSAFEMLQKESLELWKCIFFLHKNSSRFCWVMSFENRSFSSVLSHFS